VPCPVSNVRRMSPRRASVRPKAFKCTHEPRSSAALFRVQRRTVQFVGVEVKSGSDDVALDAMWGSGPSSHVRYAVRDPNVHRHHPRLSLVGELRAACLDSHASLTHPAPRGASDVWRSTEHEVHSRSNGLYVSRGCILALYTCVSEYRTCVSSHRVERHKSVSSAEQKKPKKTKAESLVVVVSSSLPRSPNLPPPAPRVAP